MSLLPSNPDRPAGGLGQPAAGRPAGGLGQPAAGRPAGGLTARLLVVAAVLAACAGLALLVDLPVAQWLGERGWLPQRTRQLPGDLVRIVNLSEVFGYSPTAGIILLAAFLLDRSLVRRMSLSADGLRMVAITFSGGITTDLIKLMVTRVRPYAADLALHASAVDTFSNIEGAGGVAIRSFPSGHAAVAAGLASALCWRYPRGAPLFIAVAIAAAAQRLTSGSHYVSDVAAGAAIAVAWAAFWLRAAERSNPT